MTPLLLFLSPFIFSALQVPVRIEVTTRMVEVTVLVRDAGGRPVTGLAREDFRLLDDGREESIRTFGALDWGRPERPERGDGRPRVSTVVLFDQFKARFANQAYARDVLLRFLRRAELRQPVALISFDSRVWLLHDYSTDTPSLVRALETFQPGRPPSSGTFTPGAAGVPAFARIDRIARQYYAGERERMNPRAIEGLVRFLKGHSGRKNVIWVAGWFPPSLARALRGDDVAVYPIDEAATPCGPPQEAKFLAALTGGAAFDHGSDILAQIRDSYEDAHAAYSIGYYPTHGAWNGRYHRLQVTVKRGDAQVRHRPGYMAVPDRSGR